MCRRKVQESVFQTDELHCFRPVGHVTVEDVRCGCKRSGYLRAIILARLLTFAAWAYVVSTLQYAVSVFTTWSFEMFSHMF